MENRRVDGIVGGGDVLGRLLFSNGLVVFLFGTRFSDERVAFLTN